MAPQTAAVPQFGHVVLLVEENHGYSQIIGSPDMPYMNSLAAKYGLATKLALSPLAKGELGY